jgi:uncharacterized membrane protein YkvA (DUF1232 family)
VTLVQRLRSSARRLRAETFALWLAARDPRTPWYARVLVWVVVAYALSPIDLIPDVIPVLGYLDDLLLVPLGIVVALRLVPADVMAECRHRVAHSDMQRPGARWLVAAAIVSWWVVALAGCAWWLHGWWVSHP